MTIKEYIESKPVFNIVPFVTVYAIIMELMKDGILRESALEKNCNACVDLSQPEPEGEACGRLYCARDFHSDR